MKNDVIVNRINATIFFMSEYAYRHLWHNHGGGLLFDYVDRLEDIFRDFYGSCSQELLDAFIEYKAMSLYTSEANSILADLQNFMCSYRNLEKFNEVKDALEVFDEVYRRAKKETDNAVRLSNEHGVYLTRIRNIQLSNLDPLWNERNYADNVVYPFLGTLVSSKLDGGDVKILSVGNGRAEHSNSFEDDDKVGFFINPFHEENDFDRIYDIIKFVSSLYLFAKTEEKKNISSEVLKNCFSGFYKEQIHKTKLGLDKRVNGLKMWDLVYMHNKDKKYAISYVSKEYCINKKKRTEESCKACCPTQDCYSSLQRDLDVAISSIEHCVVCTTKHKPLRR